jgi:hypothetical protein
MKTLFATLISFALLVQTSGAPGRVVDLALPRDLKEDEGVSVELTLGVLGRGAEIVVETVAGKHVGVVSPYGIRAGEEAGTYTVPVPREAISDNRVSLRLILQYAGEKRTPTDKEIKDVRLKITCPCDG